MLKVFKVFYNLLIKNSMSKKKNYNFSYLNSGVNVNLGNELVKAIKPISKKINDKNVLNGIGGFGAVYNLKHTNYKRPLLVSATDGVGTKILIAKDMNKYDTIGIDLVAMSVNDLYSGGAIPICFLDYIAVDKLDNYKCKWKEHLEGRRNWQFLLWNFYVFQKWYQRWV